MANTSPIVFQGSKFFWRTRKTIDVTIVEHKGKDLTEIIAYEPSLDQESPRIYLNSTILYSFLDQEAITAKLSFAKQNNVPHTATFLRNTFVAASVEFILNHIFMTQYSVDTKTFVVEMQLSCHGANEESGCDRVGKLICSAPADLVPHETKHFKRVTQAEVNAAFVALHDEQRAVAAHCSEAEALRVETASVLTVKERWRIPLILVKVVKNRPLSEVDAKIWSTVAKNFKIDDVESVISSSRPVTACTASIPCSPCATPARSRPSTTGNAVPVHHATAVSAHGPLTPRNSHRLFASTVSSQSRAQLNECIAKVDKPRKLSKRNSKGIGKSKRHSKSRLAAGGGGDSNDGAKAQPPSFLNQLASGLSTLASALSGTHRAPKVHVAMTDVDDEEDETELTVHFSVRGSVKTLSSHASVSVASVSSADISEQRRQLADLRPHLLGTLSTAPSLTGDQAFLVDEDHTTDLLSTQEESPRRKRRSYFGSILASFSRSSTDGVVIQGLHKQESKSGGQIYFGDALAEWLNWNSNPQVVPEVM